MVLIRSWYTGVWFLVQKTFLRKVFLGGSHVTAYALIHWLSLRKFMIMWFKLLLVQFEQLRPKVRIRSDYDHKLFEFAILVHLNCSNWIKIAYSKSLNADQNCKFEKFESRDHKFSERKSPTATPNIVVAVDWDSWRLFCRHIIGNWDGELFK